MGHVSQSDTQAIGTRFETAPMIAASCACAPLPPPISKDPKLQTHARLEWFTVARFLEHLICQIAVHDQVSTLVSYVYTSTVSVVNQHCKVLWIQGAHSVQLTASSPTMISHIAHIWQSRYLSSIAKKLQVNLYISWPLWPSSLQQVLTFKCIELPGRSLIYTQTLAGSR